MSFNPKVGVADGGPQNFGIILAFGFAFLSIFLALTEVNTAVAGQSSVTLFKRGSKVDSVKDNTDRKAEEETSVSQGSATRSSKDRARTPAEPPTMADIFSWRHLEYTVPISGGKTRSLLNDVSGYVAPGKLTALMGESGAGKVCIFNIII